MSAPGSRHPQGPVLQDQAPNVQTPDAALPPPETLSEHACFGGVQGFYRHDSRVIGLPMRFSVYRPPQAAAGPLPVLYYLAGLTCSEETFAIKAGAHRHAAEHGLLLVAPDTGPRGANLPGEADDWQLGVAASFYLDATRPPWARHYRMHTYLTEELPALIRAHFPAQAGPAGVFGHSMGGHGALVLALRHPELYASVSAFAPVAAPAHAPWGVNAFTNYLGPERETWRDWDASALMARHQQAPFPGGILIDQGLADRFLAEQLHPDVFEDACRQAGQPLTLRRHPGYDHSYYFIASFVAEHLAWHARALKGGI